MKLTALYIDNQLADLPDDIAIRLNKILYEPSKGVTANKELSYSLSLPFSAVNNLIFGYSNVEEIRNKFDRLRPARLYSNEIEIFRGYFLLSSIKDEYKGNLVIPKIKTIKDIFDDRSLREIAVSAGNWFYPFDVPNGQTAFDLIRQKDSETVAKIDNGKYIPDCVFPYVLRGLVPKTPIKYEHWVNGENVGLYSSKTLIDKYARFGLEEFSPSFNVLKMLKKIFEANNLHLGGSAFADDRLRLLMMSYTNANDFIQEWNFGQLGEIKLAGSYSTHGDSSYPHDREPATSMLERHIFSEEYNIGSNDRAYKVLYTNLLDANNITISKAENKGGNILIENYKDKINRDATKVDLIIPMDGWYKINLKVDARLNNSTSNNWAGEKPKKIQNINGEEIKLSSSNHSSTYKGCFDVSRAEINLLRDYGTGEFQLNRYCQLFNSPNFKQSVNGISSIFPKNEGLAVMDASVNQNFVCGLSFGQGRNDNYNPTVQETQSGHTTGRGLTANASVIKNGWSINADFAQKEKIQAVYNGKTADKTNYIRNGENIAERYSEVLNAPISKASTSRTGGGTTGGNGNVSTIIYLSKGERLTLGLVQDKRQLDGGADDIGSIFAYINFDLEITPFRRGESWGNFLDNGSYDSNRILDWNDTNLNADSKIDLFTFLPNDVKANDFIENFCKAFNLDFVQVKENSFELNTKTQRIKSNTIIDLDSKASLDERENQALDIPSEVNISFTIKDDEQGYFETQKDGSGFFKTGAINDNVLTEKSTFSYNWFKKMRIEATGQNIDLPIISNTEVWNDTVDDYGEMMLKVYRDYPIRFWYVKKEMAKLKDGYYTILLSNSLEYLNKIELTYEDKHYSITRAFFDIIVSNESNYTILELYLTPFEYQQINSSTLIRFNDDSYFVASISGFDSSGRNKAKLKLIRRIIK